jgi:hypothetical protein
MIDLQVMTEEEIATNNIELSELWMVRIHDEIFGPYHVEGLKEYAAHNEQIFADADVAVMGDENWVMFLQSSLRAPKRKAAPQLVSASTLQTHNSYHLERHGHRHGPHTHDQIAELVKKGELLPTDLISDDDGFTWHKLYQMKAFEARPHQVDLLPMAPSEESFTRAHEEAMRSLMVEENPVKEGLVSLAHYGHRKASATPLNLEELTSVKASSPVIAATASAPRSWWAGASAATAVLAVMIWWSQAPAPTEVAQVEVDEASVSEGESLLNDNSARRVRRPASTRPGRIIPPTSMRYNSRQELMNYRDTHDTDREIPEPAEPMDVDPYGADSQVAQDNGNAEADAARAPATPDDGYRLEEPVPGETGPVVEEVGDF